MGSIVKTLFGGSETKSKSVQSSKPVDITPPEVEGLRGDFVSALSSLLSGPGLDSIPSFGQPNVAPLQGRESQVLDTLLADLQGPRGGLINQTIEGNFLPGQPGANPFLQATIEAAQRPTLEGLTETLERSLPGRFTAAGQFVQPQGSSAFDRAAAIATRGVANALSDIATNISFGTQEAERGRQQEAIQLGQQEVETLRSNLQAQALPRLIEDLGIQRGLEEFQVRLNALLQALGVATSTPLQTVGQVSEGRSTSRGESQPGIFNALFPKGLTGSGTVFS